MINVRIKKHCRQTFPATNMTIQVIFVFENFAAVFAAIVGGNGVRQNHMTFHIWPLLTYFATKGALVFRLTFKVNCTNYVLHHILFDCPLTWKEVLRLALNNPQEFFKQHLMKKEEQPSVHFVKCQLWFFFKRASLSYLSKSIHANLKSPLVEKVAWVQLEQFWFQTIISK